MRVNFGKNRVQHEQFFWTFYQFKDYRVYKYLGGEKLAEYVGRNYEPHLKIIEKKIGFTLRGDVNFIVYNKLSEYKQSNIDFDDLESGTGGVTKIAGSNVFLYYEGDYNQFDLQIRSELSTILVNRMFYGDNWKEVIRNATLLSIPEWYTNGLISFVSKPWNSETENHVKDGIITNRFKKFNRLNTIDQTYAGHAIWNYISDVYGEEVIPNILYMARVSRSIENGFLFVLGISLYDLINDAWLHYQINYNLNKGDEENFKATDELKSKTKAKHIYYQMSKNPKKNELAYVKNNQGQYKVQVTDLDKNKKKTFAKGGIRYDRLPDYSYPLIEWRPDGKILAIIDEKNAEPLLTLVDIETGKKYERPVFKVDEVTAMSYSEDGKKLILSATLKGQSDLWEYKLNANTVKRVTNDIYDDLDPKYINQKGQIVFSSNRPNDSLVGSSVFKNDINPTKDLFIFKAKKEPYFQLTKTPYVNEVQPIAIDENRFYYLADNKKIASRYLARLDSIVASIDTAINYRYIIKTARVSNFERSISEQQILAPENSALDLVYKNKKYRAFETPLTKFELNDSSKIIDENGSLIEPINNDGIKTIEILAVPIEDINQEQTANINDYTFGGEIRDEKSSNTSQNFITNKFKKTTKNTSQKAPFKMPIERNYTTNFSYTDITSTLDFNFANQLYQPFNGGPYTNPGLGMLIKVSLYDLFEDYKVECGARVGFRNSSRELFIGLHDRSKRLDKSYVLKRQSLKFDDQFSTTKVVIYKGEYKLNYPLNEFFAVRSELSLRLDRTIFAALDASTLIEPDLFVTQPGAKIELVFDNAKSKGPNLFYGTKFKAFVERYQQLNDINNNDLNVLGFDYRHYQKISRELIWASRVAASTSLGKRKLVYYLGSVDDWMVLNTRRERFNTQTPIAQDKNYTFQALASPLRGFIQNARNGNSFGVINNEIRFPVFRYFARRPIKSDFTYNFQLVALADIGSAWNGRTPFSEDNDFNTITTVDGPVTVRLDNKRNPILGAFGGGVRTKLMGYFLKLDYAYGVEDGQILEPVIHISMGFDF